MVTDASGPLARPVRMDMREYMKVVERYVLRRVLDLFVAALFWTLAIVWTTQVLARIDLVTDSGQSALTFFEIATLILPSIIPHRRCRSRCSSRSRRRCR